MSLCIFTIGLLDVGHITHDVFLAIYFLALTVNFTIIVVVILSEHF